jgi:hypothetical protein
METNLRPMSLGEILDRTVQLYRANFLLFAGIAAAYAGVLLVVGLAQTGVEEWMRVEHMTRALLWTGGISVLVTWIFIFICGGITVAANNCAVAWVHLGKPATIRGAYRTILPRVGRYLWLMVLKTFLAWSPVIVIYAGFIGITIFFRVKGILPKPGETPHLGANEPAVIVFGVLAVILLLLLLPAMIYGILMGLRYALAVPACVIENLTARMAIRRSIELSKFSRGRIFVLWMLVAVIEIALIGVSQFFFIVVAVKNHQQLPVGLRILQQLVAFCTTTFVAPILATGITLFYYDQRIRKEGYDIEWMMQTAGLTAPAEAGQTPAAQGEEQRPDTRTGPETPGPLEPLGVPMETQTSPAEASPVETSPVASAPGETPPAPEAEREQGSAHE